MAADSQEYFWGCELRKDKPETTWSFEEEEEEEEEDTEYLIHTLFLKHHMMVEEELGKILERFTNPQEATGKLSCILAVLGPSAVKGERNIVEIETKNFEKNTVKQSLLSLTLGQQDMFMLDISFSQGSPVTFRLIEGSGPVCLAGQQLVEYPDDANESQDESMLEEDLEEEDISKDEESFKKVPAKRKASSQISGKVKKGKRDSSPDEEEDEEDEEDEDMESEEMDEEDEDDDGKSDKKKFKGKKVKREGDASQAGKKLKSAKASPKRAVKAAAKSKKAVKK